MKIIGNAMTAHRLKLKELEAGPRPYHWEISGSIAYHKAALRALEQEIKKREAEWLEAGKKKEPKALASGMTIE